MDPGSQVTAVNKTREGYFIITQVTAVFLDIFISGDGKTHTSVGNVHLAH